MEQAGNIFLHFAGVFSVFACLSSLTGYLRKNFALTTVGMRALWAYSALVFLSASMLIGCLLTGKFNLEYVYAYSNRTMPVFYKFASFWGGQNGSLLFWLSILCAYSSIAVYRHRLRNKELMPVVVTTLSFVATFFLIVLIFKANPFAKLPFPQPDGKGLNPLLQNFYMIIHPPSLYLGYVGMTIPFAFAMAALATRRLDNKWIIDIRTWTLLAWFFLSLGNLLGASWAYEVLGWGGYWAWDPVENAAFIPWLTSTAFLHSAIIQEKRNMLKVWNMVLVILSFLMTMTGTFLTRSGIVSSVHAFAQSDIGPYFVVFIVIAIASSVILLVSRLKDLESKSTLDSLISRESTFLLNNLVLVGMAFAILWGTLFPVISEAVRKTKITVGPPYFNTIMIPIGLMLLALTGIGPLVAWRKSTKEQLIRNFVAPILAALVTSVASYALLPHSPKLLVTIYTNISFSLSAFVLVTIYMEYSRGIRTRRKIFSETFITALLKLLDQNRRRYGGYIVHFGIVLIFVGLTGNAFRKEADFELKPKDYAHIGAYTVQYDSIVQAEDDHKQVVGAKIYVWKDKKPLTTLKPAKIFYKTSLAGEEPQPDTKVAVRRSLAEDFYTAFIAYDPDQKLLTLKAVINPLVQFLWIGGLFVMLGGFITMWPTRRKKEGTL